MLWLGIAAYFFIMLALRITIDLWDESIEKRKSKDQIIIEKDYAILPEGMSIVVLEPKDPKPDEPEWELYKEKDG